MSKLYLDLGIVLFFLTALVLVGSARARIDGRSKGAFGLVATGISLFALMSVFTAIQNQLVGLEFFGKSFIAGGEFLRLLMLVAGLMFTASGVSKWLTISNSSQTAQTLADSTHLPGHLSKRLVRLVTESGSFDNFLRLSLVFFSDNLNLSAGTVYSISRLKHRAQLLASIGSFKSTGNLSDEFIANSEWLDGLEDSKLTVASVSFAELHPNAGGICYCFPVQLSSRRTVLYLLWTQDCIAAEQFDSESLKIIAAAVRTRVQDQHLAVKQEFKIKCDEIAQSLKDNITRATSANEMIRIARKELQSYLPADYLSVSSIHKSGICRRISIGPSETTLSEIDTKFGSGNSYVNDVINKKQLVTYNDVSDATRVEFPQLLKMNGIKSVTAL
ncbi:MAG: hypothetical protein ACREBV_03970, partial [Candidatus Zixiibacteriota bacterium]